jgi:hypothetical protein
LLAGGQKGETVMEIDKDKRYEFVTSSARYHNEKIIQAFQLFVKLTTALIAGVVYLSVNRPGGGNQNDIAAVANFAEAAVCIVAAVLIITNLLGCWDSEMRNQKSWAKTRMGITSSQSQSSQSPV